MRRNIFFIFACAQFLGLFSMNLNAMGPQEYRCLLRYCTKTFPTPDALRFHVECHRAPFDCRECYLRFAKIEFWMRHLIRNHHTCPLCSVNFGEDARPLVHHMNREHKFSTYMCGPDCNLFFSESDLNRHKSSNDCVEKLEERFIEQFACCMCQATEKMSGREIVGPLYVVSKEIPYYEPPMPHYYSDKERTSKSTIAFQNHMNFGHNVCTCCPEIYPCHHDKKKIKLSHEDPGHCLPCFQKFVFNNQKELFEHVNLLHAQKDMEIDFE